MLEGLVHSRDADLGSIRGGLEETSCDLPERPRSSGPFRCRQAGSASNPSLLPQKKSLDRYTEAIFNTVLVQDL
jgi:hypothetical protein